MLKKLLDSIVDRCKPSEKEDSGDYLELEDPQGNVVARYKLSESDDPEKAAEEMAKVMARHEKEIN